VAFEELEETADAGRSHGAGVAGEALGQIADCRLPIVD
jgi:hypothetical protein